MSRRTRRLRGHLIIGLLGLAVVLAVLPLLLILGTLVVKGVTSLNWAFFTEIPAPAGETYQLWFIGSDGMVGGAKEFAHLLL